MADKTGGAMSKGFVCQCGKEHQYPAYVFAHWNEELIFTCPECRKKYSIVGGIASLRAKAKDGAPST